METERLRRVHRLLDEALARDEGERLPYVREACGEDSEVRQEVEALLAVDADLVEDLDRLALLPRWSDEGFQPGDAIGPYRVLRRLGEGGMGEVYLSTRADHEFERQVAIKVVKRGLETAALLGRFRAERQILANLEHPNIARLHEGGTTADDRPYFVLEYVEGLPIDQFCDRECLTLLQRLELFLKVGAAVQFAHQKLVVHRDLKPSNILVTADGEPRLLDFGISRVLDPATHQAEAMTVVGSRALTPEYASPEQALGQAVTTSTDVYSLGVLLYELLCGARPYHWDDKPQTEEEILRVICTCEPPQPSSALAAGAAGETVARKRRTTRARLRRQLQGDLDVIVLMALRKEPERRYASVEQLLEDLRRYLTGRPVRARRSTLGYRAMKMLRRRKPAEILLALLLGLGALVFVGHRELLLRETVRQRDRAEQLSQFMEEIFDLTQLEPGRREELSARDLLREWSRKLEDRPAGSQDVEADLQLALGRAFARFGLPSEARTYVLRSVALWEAQGKGAWRRRSEALLELSSVQAALGDFRQADAAAAQALRLGEEGFGAGSSQLGHPLTALAMLRADQGNYSSAEELLRRALGVLAEAGEDRDRSRLTVKGNLALVLFYRGKLQESAQLYYETLDLARNLMPEDNPQISAHKSNLAFLLNYLGDPKEAERLFREVLEVYRRKLEPKDLAISRVSTNLAGALMEQGRWQQARELLEEALSNLESRPEQDLRALISTRRRLGRALVATGEPEAGQRLLKRALADQRALFGDDHPDTARGLLVLAAYYRDAGALEEAAPLLQKALELRRKQGEEHPAYGEAMLEMALLELALGRTAAARQWADRAAAIFAQRFPKHQGQRILARALNLYLDASENPVEARRDQARAELRDAWKELVQRFGPASEPAQTVAAWRRQLETVSSPESPSR